MSVTLAALWRYPVKSMAGEPVERLDLDPGGVRGDRQWAVWDVERGVPASARRLPALLRLRARTERTGVVVEMPDGARHEPGRELDAALSAYADREVRLVPLPTGRGGHRLPLRALLDQVAPGSVARDLGIRPDETLPAFERMTLRSLLGYGLWSTPPGSYVDLSPVHLLTGASLAAVGDADARRFRPTALLDGVEGHLPEAGWSGATVTLGGAEVAVTMPTVRCVVPSREHADLPLDRGLTRVVAERAERYLGCYADVRRAGVVAVGDRVEVRLPSPPGAVRRAAGRGRRAVVRGAVRLADRVLR